MDTERLLERLRERDPRAIARAISLVEDGDPAACQVICQHQEGLVMQQRFVTILRTGTGDEQYSREGTLRRW